MHGIELWKSDGTDAGTVLVKDIEPGSGGSYPGKLENSGQLLTASLFFRHVLPVQAMNYGKVMEQTGELC